ncbi:hypothetical protein PILCRDRAFT_812094 [Piloderma croceum F 1598]|uniref:Uncharacterized protein n=1 Tax=Piloderma croceum (strain F 1598) TaxID=765440 RepID=A0A0C3GI98_PILCF|nr:hypothetical protein PILCRDRAFT_812094 [Piloderma croceum F 1598]
MLQRERTCSPSTRPTCISSISCHSFTNFLFFLSRFNLSLMGTGQGETGNANGNRNKLCVCVSSTCPALSIEYGFAPSEP